jgi:hypothetical protein
VPRFGLPAFAIRTTATIQHRQRGMHGVIVWAKHKGIQGRGGDEDMQVVSYPDTPSVFDAIHDAIDPKLHLLPLAVAMA